jgi:uncharacterized membrane protein
MDTSVIVFVIIGIGALLYFTNHRVSISEIKSPIQEAQELEKLDLVVELRDEIHSLKEEIKEVELERNNLLKKLKYIESNILTDSQNDDLLYYDD